MQYRVRKGDTLGGIADRYSVSPDDIRKWNHLKAAHVGRGMVLRIYTVGGAPEASPTRSKARSKPNSTTKPSATAASSSAKNNK